MRPLERDIEAKCRAIASDREMLFLKFVCPGNAGVPDRLVIAKGPRFAFVELKTETGRVSRLQAAMHKILRSFGCYVAVVRSVEEFKDVLDAIQK